MMPQDVTTQWNLTYDMLVFALEYRRTLVKITGEQDTGLRLYELCSSDWDIVEQLCKALKMRNCTLSH